MRRFQYTGIDDATRVRALKVYQLLTCRDDVNLEKKLPEWERFYNDERPMKLTGAERHTRR